MKIIKKRMQSISIVLIVLMLFQSCRVYHNENVSLDKAVTEGKRVKVVTKAGQKLKFKKVLLDSGQYYGIKKVKGETLRVLIKPNDIESLRLHNKTMSIIYGTGIGIVIALVGSTILFLATWDGPELNFASSQSPN